jgi:hypothetical protein
MTLRVYFARDRWKPQVDAKARGLEIVDEAIEVQDDLVNRAIRDEGTLSRLPGNVFVGGNLKGALGGRSAPLACKSC